MPAKKLTTAQKAANAKKKLDVAKNVLEKRSAQTKASKKAEIAIANIDNPRGSSNWHYKQNRKIQAYKKQKELTEALTKSKGFVSQAVTDRSRTATRAAAVAKRVTKKGK